MIQQVIKIGNSVGVIIPRHILEEKKIQVGDKLNVEIEPVKSVPQEVDARFMKMVDEFIEEHKDVLAALAKK